nr:CDP-glycerol glycerophosphotransferase family protein [Mammaliicoccus sp. Marseille-Q6498]
MKIKILGFNLFAKGGTSRSNINLIKTFIRANHEVAYYNLKHFDKSARFNTMINEELNDTKLTFETFNDAADLKDADLVILTRESFFYIARELKILESNAKIVGEIHAPLAYISNDQDLAFDAIDAYRVSSKEIKKDFMKRFNVKNVFNQYVDASHIRINDQPSITKRNLLIKARFEDNIKDISYVIKLMNCIVNVKGNENIQLYIKGYGPSEVLYKNLIDYYNLEDHIHINQKEPMTYVYISSSPYETLGYSILESIAEGNKTFIFEGEDGALHDIYHKYHAVRFLEKNIETDCEQLLSFIEKKYTKQERTEDIIRLKETFIDRDYADDFINSSMACMDERKKVPLIHINKKKKIKRKSKLDKGRDLYETYKNKPILKSVLNNQMIFNFAKKRYQKKKTNHLIRYYNQITPSEDKVFLESFHGSNFSGDPKYIAIYLKKHYPNKEIFVSSQNALVDMEIRNYNLIPVRFGSELYSRTFRECKYVFVNSNTLDKVYKHSEQIFIQTWHGFPLKRMLNDLNDLTERKLQVDAFKPRMKKWDYLLSSSEFNTMLFDSAFGTKNNEHLKILQLGAPRNEYLISSGAEEEERIRSKYFFTSKRNKKFILFCPTWRQEKRKILSKTNLNVLLDNLPDEYEIIVKLHPNEAHLRANYSNLSDRVHCFYNEFVDIQELYLISDVMITDYSSTIFDFAHLNKLILLLQEDNEEYSNSIGFYFDIFELENIQVAHFDERILAKQITAKRETNYHHLTNRLLTDDKIGTTKNIVNFIMK